MTDTVITIATPGPQGPPGSGGGSASIVNHSATYTETSTAGTVLSLCDATAGNMVANLPAASTCSGMFYTVKKVDSTANTVTVDPNGSDTIDGGLTAVINNQYTSVTIVSNGATWYIE